MKIFLKKEKILIKNNFIYIQNTYNCFIKIPNNFYVFFKNNILILKCVYFDIIKETSFFKVIKNLLLGVNNLWFIEILISGIGYKIYLEKNKIIFNLGYTKSKFFFIPEFIKIEIKKEKIILKSVYKDNLGLFVLKIIKLKKFDPYKKKGLYLEKNIILKKSSKKKQ